METSPQKSLERIISQRALQMSSSFPCKIWALGFICGVCITYLLLVASTPLRTAQLGFVYASSPVASPQNSSLIDLEIKRSEISGAPLKDVGSLKNFRRSGELKVDERIFFLYSAWSAILDKSKVVEGESVPTSPHLEDCKTNFEINSHLDKHGENGSSPPWTLWRGLLGTKMVRQTLETQSGYNAKFEGAYPPWVVGSDEDNFPQTRRVQQDIWMHQHPKNCSDPHLRFLVADWERLPGFGIGAQLAGMTGLLAIAINENRILVTNYYNRADHDGCQGSSRSHWSCYFFPETSQECQEHAFDLMKSTEAWNNKIITVKENYTSKEIWAGRVPRVWGEPWVYLQPTTDIDGSLLMHHRKMDRRWWRAQAIRYLMRFQAEYTCHLLNVARHTSFGLQAAEMVLGSLPADWPQVSFNKSRADIEQFVWSNHRPWIPRPLLSMHVRMGDKACEMKVVAFESYMQLANRIREHFPNLNSIWLSTEMQVYHLLHGFTPHEIPMHARDTLSCPPPRCPSPTTWSMLPPPPVALLPGVPLPRPVDAATSPSASFPGALSFPSSADARGAPPLSRQCQSTLSGSALIPIDAASSLGLRAPPLPSSSSPPPRGRWRPLLLHSPPWRIHHRGAPPRPPAPAIALRQRPHPLPSPAVVEPVC